MGSQPTQQFQADLNGTGTLVDITSYVVQDSIEHRYGRSDWTAAVQPPGALSFTVESFDGRFTPGSAAHYTVGVVRNMVVQWTCGTRVRRFYLADAQLAFPTGGVDSSTVTLRCQDTLALLAARPMQAMVREATLAARPVAYWPMDETPTDGVVFHDASGNGEPALYPFTKDSGADLIWQVEAGYLDGGGRGPRTDGAAAPILNKQTTPIPIGQAVAPFSHRGGARNNLYTQREIPAKNRSLTIPDQAPYVWTAAPPAPNLLTFPVSGWRNSNGSALEYIVSLWFSIDNIYGGTSTTPVITDGPYVVLAEIALAGGNGGSYSIMWRIPDRRIVVSSGFGAGSDIAVLSTDSYSVSPTDVHHLAIWVQHREDAYFSGSYLHVDAKIRGVIDGKQLTAGSIDLGSVQYPIGITLGSYVTVAPIVSGADNTAYALSGGISNVSIHGPDQPDALGGWARAVEIWQTGTTGPLEAVSARVSRLLAWATGLPVTPVFAGQGTAWSGVGQGLVGPHDTRGKDMLTAVCEVLSSDEASLDTVTLAGVDTIRGWLDSTQRTLAPALTVDAEQDGQGSPDVAFDQSGVAAKATVNGWNQAAVWVDATAADQWKASAAAVASVMVEPADLVALAQYRTVKGRATRISPTRIVVDAAVSKADLTSTLLGLYPGATVRITGLSTPRLGYATIDCILVGVTEKYAPGSARFELALMPRGTEMYCDPELGTEGPWRFVDQPEWMVSPINGFVVSSGWSGRFMLLAGTTTGGTLSAGATTGYIVSNPKVGATAGAPYANTIPTTFFSQAAADFPLSIKVDNEIITLPNPAGAPTAVTINTTSCWYQQVTGMQRGQQGTTAATHAGGGLTSLSEDQGLTVVVPAENYPILAF